MIEKTKTKEVYEEVTEYVCDIPGCDFVSIYKSEANTHEVKSHTFSKETEVGDHKTLYFPNKKSIDTFKEYHSSFTGADRISGGGFEEPGWYVMTFDWRSCSRNCCKEHWVDLISIESYEQNQLSDLRDIIETIRTARKLMYGKDQAV